MAKRSEISGGPKNKILGHIANLLNATSAEIKFPELLYVYRSPHIEEFARGIRKNQEGEPTVFGGSVYAELPLRYNRALHFGHFVRAAHDFETDVLARLLEASMHAPSVRASIQKTLRDTTPDTEIPPL